MGKTIDIKLSQPSISPSCLQDILELLDSDVFEEAKAILREHEVEIYE